MTYSRASLEGLKMKELREIGDPLGASDTKKEELINEILVKQPTTHKSEIDKLLEDMNRFEGDMVQTYDLRWKIIEKLNELREIKKTEG